MDKTNDSIDSMDEIRNASEECFEESIERLDDLNSESNQEEELDIVSQIGEFIRDNSYYERLTNAESFLEEPFSLDVEEIHPLLDELMARQEYSDIVRNNGKEHIYLFSDKYITKNYAKMMILTEEKDLLKLIAETVRNESKTYPRPTDSRLFGKRPFNLTKDDFLQVYELLKRNDDYSDIEETRASNNALYLYSTKHMNHAHAKRLAEWIEVEAEQNP